MDCSVLSKRLEAQLLLVDRALQRAFAAHQIGYDPAPRIEHVPMLVDVQGQLLAALDEWGAVEDELDADDEVDDRDDFLVLHAALSALRWASEASEFQPGGVAHDGWCEICLPAIEQLETLLDECEEPADAVCGEVE